MVSFIDQDPQQFLNKFETTINELVSAGEEVSEEEKQSYLLLTLPGNLQHISDIFDALPTADKNIE